jgi:hypothetical protein
MIKYIKQITLIECLMILAIAALLVGIAMPAVSNRSCGCNTTARIDELVRRTSMEVELSKVDPFKYITEQVYKENSVYGSLLTKGTLYVNPNAAAWMDWGTEKNIDDQPALLVWIGKEKEFGVYFLIRSQSPANREEAFKWSKWENGESYPHIP